MSIYRALLRVVLLAAVMAVAHTGFAQQVAPTALELAKRVDDHYNRLQSLKANFVEKYDGLGMHRSESGAMLLRKPGRMRWDYTSSAGKVLVLDGKFGWFYAPGDSQVQRIPASQLDDLRSPLRFLLGHTKIESEIQDLKLHFFQSSQDGTDREYYLTGVPKGQEKRIARLTLTVTNEGAILSIVIEEIDGARTDFEFSHEQANPAIPESAFHFTPPAGIPIVDALPPV